MNRERLPRTLLLGDSDGSHQTLDVTGSGNRVSSLVFVDDFDIVWSRAG